MLFRRKKILSTIIDPVCYECELKKIILFKEIIKQGVVIEGKLKETGEDIAIFLPDIERCNLEISKCTKISTYRHISEETIHKYDNDGKKVIVRKCIHNAKLKDFTFS